ncbi:MAG: helix-turn-helix domain-containing protein, partial [Cyanobacteria bacterium Co-bin13]|nr:helix-turn-helix domain-containing protein [Cyanobacteria bacterium Co-bin13]
TVVASGLLGSKSASFSEVDPADSHFLRFPLNIQDQAGEVLIEQSTNGEVLSPRIAQAFVDLVLSQITQPTLLSDEQTQKNQVIQSLLHGQIQDAALVLRQSKLLGLDLTPPRAVILIDATDFIQSEQDPPERSGFEQRKRAQRIIESVVRFFHLPDDTICTDLGDGEFAVLKASDTKNMGDWAAGSLTSPEAASSWTNLEALKRAGDALLLRLRQDTGAAVSVGIGRYHPGVLGLSRSYQDARMALRLGRQFNGQNQVYCLDRLGIAAFACVADERTKVELARHLLSPLDAEPDLLETLKVFFDQDCALSSTAKCLLIHRNTLSYRLDKITSLTGLDPRQFDEAIQIRLAMLLQELKPLKAGQL